jgi:hypothetical protein
MLEELRAVEHAGDLHDSLLLANRAETGTRRKPLRAS